MKIVVKYQIIFEDSTKNSRMCRKLKDKIVHKFAKTQDSTKSTFNTNGAEKTQIKTLTNRHATFDV